MARRIILLNAQRCSSNIRKRSPITVKRSEVMSKVIDFPSDSVRSDAEIERGLREGMAGHGFSSDAIEAAITSTMPLLQESKSIIGGDLQVSFTSSLADEQVKELESHLSSVLQEHQREVSNFIQKLIVKIALLEARANDV